MNTPIKTADMERLSRYRQQLCQNPRLVYLFLELTDACNLPCIHCGSSSSPCRNTYLPLEKIYKVLDQVAEYTKPEGVMICLTGGEPMLHPDFYQIASYAARKGFQCGITTNGTRIDAESAEKILHSGIGSVGFSLDGIGKTHDSLRGQAGAYERAAAGIRNLVAASRGSIRTQVTTVIHKENIRYLDQIYQEILQLGVESWRIINMEPIGRALEHSELLLNGEEMQQLLEYIRRMRYARQVPVEVTYGCSHYLTGEYEREVRDNYFLCGAGIYVASILCNGDIAACLDIERRPELIQGNIDRDDFVEVWEKRFAVFRKDRAELCQSCRECEERQFCHGDSAHTWDYVNQRPLVCLKPFSVKAAVPFGIF